MPPAHFKCLQAHVRGAAVKYSSILIYAERLAWYYSQRKKKIIIIQLSGVSNASCDSEVFPSRWHESVFIYSETSTCSAAKVSWQVPLWVALIQGEEGGKERRTGSEWVSAARLLDVVFRPLSPHPACLCTAAHHLLGARFHFWTLLFPWSGWTERAERLLDLGGAEQWRPLHLLV